MAERVQGTNMVRLLEGEFLTDINNVKIEGPQIIRVSEHPDLGTVEVQGSKRISPDRKIGAKWDVKASTIEDLINKVQKNV